MVKWIGQVRGAYFYMNLTILGCTEGRFEFKVRCQSQFWQIMAQVMQNVTKMMLKLPPGDAFGKTLGL